MLATVLVAPTVLLAAGTSAGAATEALCLQGRSDGFTGTTLDTDRWSTIVRPDGNLRVEDGHLVIPTSPTDIYGTNNTGTPNIVLQDLPEGPFTATAKVTLEPTDMYQQAGLIVYGDDDNYAKMVLQARSTGSAGRIFQFIREEDGVPNEVGDSNTPILPADYPSTAWVRLTSDGADLRASYSADGVTFTTMPQTKSLAGMTDVKIGLFAVQGSGLPQAPVDAMFDHFSIIPDDTVPTATPDDEFDGAVLDGCRWDVVRPDPAHLRVADGHLEIDTTAGDIAGTSTQSPNNVVLQAQPERDWVVQTLVDASALDEATQQAGLIAYVDDDNYVKLDVLATNTAGSPVTRNLELRSEIGGVVQNPQPTTLEVDQGVWHLRLEKQGSSLTGSYSADGTSWTVLPSLENSQVAADGRVGLYALGAQSTVSASARFDYFRLVDDVTAPVLEVSLDPLDPTGNAGWYTESVSVTATASDDTDPVEDIDVEQRVGDGPWTPYTGPVQLTEDGTHDLAFRASDTSGNASGVEEVTVAVDATVPEVDLVGVTDGAVYQQGLDLTISATGSDETSGLGSVVLILDGQPVGDGSVHTLSVGLHVVRATATDVAGNSSEVTASIEVEALTIAQVQDRVARLHADGQIHVSVWRQVDNHLDAMARSQDRGQILRAGSALDRAVAAAGPVSDSAVRGELLELLGYLRDSVEQVAP